MKNRKESDIQRIRHILEAISMVEEFVRDIDQDEFERNNQTQSAVLYQFIIIGEAVSLLSREILEEYEYPWHKPRAFRNFLAHEYFGIKMWMVWNAIIKDLPELKLMVENIYSNSINN